MEIRCVVFIFFFVFWTPLVFHFDSSVASDSPAISPVSKVIMDVKSSGIPEEAETARKLRGVAVRTAAGVGMQSSSGSRAGRLVDSSGVSSYFSIDTRLAGLAISLMAALILL